MTSQVPEHARDNDQRAEKDEYVQRLAINCPADHGDQRDTHEIQGHHQCGIARAECIAQTIV